MLIIGDGEMARIAKSYIGENLELYPDAVFVAIGYKELNRVREKVFNEQKALGKEFCSYIDLQAINMADSIGLNAFILEQNVLQTGVKIGDNVMLWSGNHIGHDSEIGDHTYFASHVVLSGHCKVGKRCFFGVNSCIKDSTTIGNDCFITMGAIVTKDMPDNSVAIGRDIITGDKAQKIINKYFYVE